MGLVALTLGAHRGAALGAVLAALLTVPNVAGPWMARWLESARDPRRMLSGAFAAFGLALAGASLLLGHGPIAAVGLLITVGGLCDPLMTGGLSSRLALIVGEDQRTQRRAEGWDSATYGVGTVLGPAAVAALTAADGALAALVVLAGAAVLAGLLLLLLPAELTVSGAAGAAMTVRETLKIVAGRGPLRRITIATMISALGTGGLLVVAVVLGDHLDRSGSAGAVLGAAFGVGTLGGALLIGAFPPSGDPEKRAIRLLAVNAATIALCAAAPTYAAALAAFALAGASNAVLFTATLAVRSIYSPPAARAHVFVIMAAFKVAAASAGTALTGTLLQAGPRAVLVLSSGLVVVAAVSAVADRRLTHDREDDQDQAPHPSRPHPRQEKTLANEEEKEQAERSLEHVLQELRVIQTGVQILSAFLLTLPFTVRFAQTTTFQKSAYVLSLSAAVLTTALVIAPVSYHRRRRAEQGRDSLPDVIRVASGLAQAGMATLVVSAASGVLLALDIAAGPVCAAVITAVLTGAYVGLWWVLPAVRRGKVS